MKALFFTFLLFIAFLFNSCKKEDNKPINPIDQLPPATQIGANKAGCLVNGEVFLPKGYGIILNCFYQDGLNFGLSIAETKNQKLRSVGIGILNENLREGATYQLGQNSRDGSSKYGSYTIYYDNYRPDEYETTSSIIGELKITYHNFDKAIISGTFWFDAINSNGEKVQIREGRFDMQY
jgi:hypothetical protein